jgi:hypothetical protein
VDNSRRLAGGQGDISRPIGRYWTFRKRPLQNPGGLDKEIFKLKRPPGQDWQCGSELENQLSVNTDLVRALRVDKDVNQFYLVVCASFRLDECGINIGMHARRDRACKWSD